MARYIKATECAEITSEKTGIPLGDLVDVFAEVPTADAVEVKHGKWVYNENYCISCSNCKKHFAFRSEIWFKSDNKFCPNCGADMRER